MRSVKLFLAVTVEVSLVFLKLYSSLEDAFVHAFRVSSKSFGKAQDEKSVDGVRILIEIVTFNFAHIPL